jgi:predicted GTPase
MATDDDNIRARVLILGAAGRDYHTFNTTYRTDPHAEVVGFTHAQIPHIESSRYPHQLSGPSYPEGLPIWPASRLESVIAEGKVDVAVLAYSDISYAAIAALSAAVRSAGASLLLLGGRDGMLNSSKPVVAVTAVRTGCGKSQVCKIVIEAARSVGKKVVLVRHPMPYGDLAKQAVQRFETLEDLDEHHTTVEEREEYEQHIRNGVVVYAGVDYAAILAQAQEEADLVLWDGGNNDTPFYKPDLWLCVADPFRPGHEVDYYPGDVNFRCADAIIVNKANTAPQAGIDAVLATAAHLNPKARVYVTASEVSVNKPELVKGKRVLCVDDGPTITHGGMSSGAAVVAADKFGAAEIVDPRPYFVGELAATLAKYPHIGKVVPAMGYSEQQLKDLAATIAAVPCDSVLLGTPHDLTHLMDIPHSVVSVTYSVADVAREVIAEVGNASKLESATGLAHLLTEFCKAH